MVFIWEEESLPLLSSWGSKFEQKLLAYFIPMYHERVNVLALTLPFGRRPEGGILLRTHSLPLTRITSYQAGKLFSSWHGIWSSNWCFKTHRTRKCLIPSPAEIRTYIRAPQGKRPLTPLTNHSTRIQGSTYRNLSGTIYWSGPFYFNSVYN